MIFFSHLLKSSLLVLLVSFGLVGICLAQEGDDEFASEAEATLPINRILSGTIKAPLQKNGKTMRCWQNGRLLYEDSGFEQVFDSPSKVVIGRRDGKNVTVLNLNDGLCIVANY